MAPAGLEFTACSAITGHKSSRQKFVAILSLEMNSFQKGEPKMRIRHAIFFGSVAALAVLAVPSSARNSEAQRGGEQSTSTSPSPSCHSYQQEADGSWKQLPCRELGSGDGSRPKPSAQEGDER
jgi:hypothetical protein